MSPIHHPAHRLRLLAGGACITVLGIGCLTAAAAEGGDAPPGGTIVEVTGDAGNGFHIHHYDGTVDYPPTESESIAECGEYDTHVQRVRCKAKVRVFDRDIAATEAALDYAHQAA